MTFDAVLLLSFGGPDGPEDVLPFLENVVRGRGVPTERLLAVAEHYQHFDGVSPINAANRQLMSALTVELARAGHDLPVYWGNRNWSPYVEETVAAMTADGIRNALVFVTSGYSSFSACRQYRLDLDRAKESVGVDAPELHKLRHFFDHPGFIEPLVDGVRSALTAIDDSRRSRTKLVFTAHSVPISMANASGPAADGLYERQLRAASELVATMAAPDLSWDLVWQSRSGPPSVPWLEPDINDHLRGCAAEGCSDVVVVPIGFVSDHVEVLWDLDHEAAETAQELGLSLHRVQTPGSDPRFVTMIRELIEERIDEAAGRQPQRRALSSIGPSHDHCPLGCCPSGRPSVAAAPAGTTAH